MKGTGYLWIATILMSEWNCYCRRWAQLNVGSRCSGLMRSSSFYANADILMVIIIRTYMHSLFFFSFCTIICRFWRNVGHFISHSNRIIIRMFQIIWVIRVVGTTPMIEMIWIIQIIDSFNDLLWIFDGNIQISSSKKNFVLRKQIDAVRDECCSHTFWQFLKKSHCRSIGTPSIASSQRVCCRGVKITIARQHNNGPYMFDLVFRIEHEHFIPTLIWNPWRLFSPTVTRQLLVPRVTCLCSCVSVSI